MDDQFKKHLIRVSLSPYAMLTLLVPMNDGISRICVDIKTINKITVKYSFPIPRNKDILDKLCGAYVFTKLDIRSCYRQIKIRFTYELKTAFKTQESLYEL